MGDVEYDSVLSAEVGRCLGMIGLSLTVLLPAAAWYFFFIVCRFLPSRGQKTRVPSGRQEAEHNRQAKVLV
jgi:hypothetical protein